MRPDSPSAQIDVIEIRRLVAQGKTDFQGCHLYLQGSISLQQVDCRRAILAGDCADGRLEHVDFSGATSQEVGLVKSSIANCRFNDVELTSSSFAESYVVDCDFTSSRLVSADFRNATFVRCTFTGVEFTAAYAAGASFVDCDFTNAFADRGGQLGGLYVREETLSLEATFSACRFTNLTNFSPQRFVAVFANSSIDGQTFAASNWSIEDLARWLERCTIHSPETFPPAAFKLIGYEPGLSLFCRRAITHLELLGLMELVKSCRPGSKVRIATYAELAGGAVLRLIADNLDDLSHAAAVIGGAISDGERDHVLQNSLILGAIDQVLAQVGLLRSDVETLVIRPSLSDDAVALLNKDGETEALRVLRRTIQTPIQRIGAAMWPLLKSKVPQKTAEEMVSLMRHQRSDSDLEKRESDES